MHLKHIKPHLCNVTTCFHYWALVSISKFTCTPIFHYYFEYDNIPNSGWIFRIRPFSKYSIFRLRRGIFWYYSGFRGILWTCMQRIRNMRLSWGFCSSLWQFMAAYGQICALLWLLYTKRQANSLQGCSRDVCPKEKKEKLFKRYERQGFGYAQTLQHQPL